MKVGFVGLGAMGVRMAKCVLRGGFELQGFDLSAERLTEIEAAGGVAVSDAAAAARGADVLILMVVNAAQARAVLFEADAISALPKGGLVLSSVTMPSDDAAAIGEQVELAGRMFLDAPVSGGTAGAERGTLTFMTGGSDAAFDCAEPLMRAMGANLFKMGPKPGAGSTMKMVHQLAAGCNLAVAAEVMSLGAHLGLPPAQLLEVLNVSAGGSWMISDRGPRMLTEGESAMSAVDIFVKDLGIVLDAARAAKFPAPVTASALQIFLGASAAGYGRHDDSQATRFYEQLGGKKVRSEGES
ncbi:MAG: NAD(P)-dependent oxidoreductase [Neomegalonema sp.]|nr:NAD(P)-dependent oxidoreductase [Neomegalonema sp.]